MKAKKVTIFLMMMLIIAVIIHFCLTPVTFLTDPLYGKTSLAQTRTELRLSLLKEGKRLRVVTLDKFPSSAKDAEALFAKEKGTVICSPLVTSFLSSTLPSGYVKNIVIGMGKDGEGNRLFSVVLEADDGDGYVEAARSDKILQFIWQGKEEPKVAEHYVRSTKITGDSPPYIASLLDKWKEEDVMTVVAYQVECLPAFFKESEIPFTFVVPSLYLLSVPEDAIKGLIIDDLPSSLGFLDTVVKGKPQLVLPLIRSYRPGVRIAGGSLERRMQSFLRLFR